MTRTTQQEQQEPRSATGLIEAKAMQHLEEIADALSDAANYLIHDRRHAPRCVAKRINALLDELATANDAQVSGIFDPARAVKQ
jgi:hypothetical protein